MKRFFRNTGGAITAVILALIGVSAANAWGPERTTFTMDKPASYVTFDSITDNQSSESVGIGDERNFVRVRKTGETTPGMVKNMKYMFSIIITLLQIII